MTKFPTSALIAAVSERNFRFFGFQVPALIGAVLLPVLWFWASQRWEAMAANLESVRK